VRDRVGVHIGSGIGGFDVIEREHNAMLQGGPRKISPFFIPASIINLAAGQSASGTAPGGRMKPRRRPALTSAHSIGDAYRIIERDDADR